MSLQSSSIIAQALFLLAAWQKHINVSWRLCVFALNKSNKSKVTKPAAGTQQQTCCKVVHAGNSSYVVPCIGRQHTTCQCLAQHCLADCIYNACLLSMYCKLNVLQVENVDAPEQPGNITCIRAKLDEPLKAGSSIDIECYSVHVGLMTPFPAKASQSDPQRVLLKGSSHVVSPYQISTQSTKASLYANVHCCHYQHLMLSPSWHMGAASVHHSQQGQGAVENEALTSASHCSNGLSNDTGISGVTRLALLTVSI